MTHWKPNRDEAIRLLEEISLTFGPSGCEEEVATFIESRISSLCDSYVRDRMGNVIALCRFGEKDAPKRKVMISAHMDEVGLMVINATDDGLLRVRAIGGIDPRVLVSKRVKVGYAVPAKEDQKAKKPLSGVIGAMAIHQQSAADRKNVLPIDQLFVDIGAKDKDEALRYASAGTPITFDELAFSKLIWRFFTK